jgi:hypothetical protein
LGGAPQRGAASLRLSSEIPPKEEGKTPMIDHRPPAQPSKTAPTTSDLDAFLAEIGKPNPQTTHSRGRLIFALDATASRQPTWDAACTLQAKMFQTVTTVGTLNMQLVYYRGLSECRASRWISNPDQLAKTMSQITCNAGQTQIAKVLLHTHKEAKLLPVSALVFVGDACEEDVDHLAHQANELAKLHIPAFMFQEGNIPKVESAFRTIAQYTHGAYARFNQGAAQQLAELLKAVAVFAVGGIAALETSKNANDKFLLRLMKSSR